MAYFLLILEIFLILKVSSKKMLPEKEHLEAFRLSEIFIVQ